MKMSFHGAININSSHRCAKHVLEDTCWKVEVS